MTHKSDIPELIADGAVHLAGIVASIFAGVLLIIHVAVTGSALSVAAISLYTGIIIFSFTVSGIYNLWQWEKMREPLRRIDHAAIFLKIAGTYTPIVLILGSMFGYVLLGFIWGVAICAAMGKLVFANWPRSLSVTIYLALGWAAVLLIGPMFQTFDSVQLVLIAIGSALYTFGTLFYVWDDLRYQTAIWHGFVLTASACFFAAIALTV